MLTAVTADRGSMLAMMLTTGTRASGPAGMDVARTLQGSFSPGAPKDTLDRSPLGRRQ